MEKFVYLAIITLASFGLGFWIGNAYATSKYTRKQRKLTRRVQVLENFKHAVKVLCPKIRDDDTETSDYLPEKIKGIEIPKRLLKIKKIMPVVEDDEDTKTGELKIEKVTKGHPDEA